MENSKIKFNPRTVLFREGDSADKVYIILSGEIVCLKSSKGKLVPVFKAVEGDIIGESAILEKAPYTYSAITRSNVQLIEIHSKDMHDILKHSPGWLANLTSTLVSRFNNTANLIATNRVIHYSVMSEDEYTPERESDYKQLLSNKIE